MAKHAAALKVEPPRRSPEREALAQAIAKAAAANRRLRGAKAAEEAYAGSVGRAEDAVDEAKAAVDAANDRAAKVEVARALGDPIPEGLTPAQARAALEAARDAFAIAEEAKRRITAEVRDAENAAAYVDPRSALGAALKADSAVRAVIDGFDEMTREFYNAQQVMSVLASAGALSFEESHFPRYRPEEWGEGPHAPRWAAAIEALKTNPDAELPAS